MFGLGLLKFEGDGYRLTEEGRKILHELVGYHRAFNTRILRRDCKLA